MGGRGPDNNGEDGELKDAWMGNDVQGQGR